MSGSLPWAQPPTPAPPIDPNEALRRIERNTADMVRWMKILVVAVAVLVVVTLFLY